MASSSGTDRDIIVNFLKRGDRAGARATMMTHLLGLYRETQAADDQDGGNPRRI